MFRMKAKTKQILTGAVGILVLVLFAPQVLNPLLNLMNKDISVEDGE
jgi:hypothetical protein